MKTNIKNTTPVLFIKRFMLNLISDLESNFSLHIPQGGVGRLQQSTDVLPNPVQAALGICRLRFLPPKEPLAISCPVFIFADFDASPNFMNTCQAEPNNVVGDYLNPGTQRQRFARAVAE